MNTKFRKIAVLAALAPLLVVSLAARPADEPPAPADDKSIEAVTKLVAPAVVRVEARDGMRKVATGVVMDRDGYIVTTALISPWDEEITVITSEGRRVKADFIGLDVPSRLAVLKAKEKMPGTIVLGKTEGLAPGTWVGVVGLSPENTPAVTQGIVSSVASDWLRLNVWVVRGSSGSPVVNRDGQMIGLLRGAYFEDNPVLFEFREQQIVGSGYAFSRAQAPASGMAQAIPIDVVKDVYGQIKANGKVSRGWLGISTQLNEDGRLQIVEVEDDSPASLAKLKEGDVILKLDGKDITGPEVLGTEIRMRKPGQTVSLTVNRGGKTLDIKVRLGEFSEEDARLELERSFPRLFNMTAPRPGGPMPEMPRSDRPKLAPPMPRPNLIWEKRKFIGLFLSQTTKELGEFFGLKDGVGLLVNAFTDNSPAQKAGLRVGDVIFKADGKRIQSVDDLAAVLQDKKKGDKIKLEFLRDKKPMSVNVEVMEEENQGPLSLNGDFFNGGFALYDGPSGRIRARTQAEYEALLKKMMDDFQKQGDTLKKQGKAGALRYAYSGNTYRI
jgi:serine protease Do